MFKPMQFYRFSTNLYWNCAACASLCLFEKIKKPRFKVAMSLFMSSDFEKSEYL